MITCSFFFQSRKFGYKRRPYTIANGTVITNMRNFKIVNNVIEPRSKKPHRNVSKTSNKIKENIKIACIPIEII